MGRLGTHLNKLFWPSVHAITAKAECVNGSFCATQIDSEGAYDYPNKSGKDVNSSKESQMVSFTLLPTGSGVSPAQAC